MRRAIAICTLSGLLCSCSLLPAPGEPSKKITLTALSTSDVFGEDIPYKARHHQLIVDVPTLYPPIDSTRIALKPQEQTIDYYADVEWADRLSALIQESLIYSLQNKGILRGASRPTEGIEADYSLKVEVRKFYVVQKDTPQGATAQVDYMVHLVKLPQRHIVASRNFTHAQIIPENTMDNIIKSLNIAHLEVSRAMVPWVLDSMR
jgi:cholesterol transport system auxiliary component